MMAVTAAALFGAGVVVVGFLIEAVVAGANGWGTALDTPHLYGTTTASHLVLLEHTLLLLAWSVSGWLVAVGCRFGALRGTLVIIPAAIPQVAAELALATGWSGDLLVGWLGISRPPLLVAVLLAAAAIVGGGLVAHRVTTRLQLRVTPGWTTQ